MAQRLPPPPAALPLGVAGGGGARAKKERLLTCLQKLNDRDTQKSAAQELAELLLVGVAGVQATCEDSVNGSKARSSACETNKC